MARFEVVPGVWADSEKNRTVVKCDTGDPATDWFVVGGPLTFENEAGDIELEVQLEDIGYVEMGLPEVLPPAGPDSATLSYRIPMAMHFLSPEKQAVLRGGEGALERAEDARR